MRLESAIDRPFGDDGKRAIGGPATSGEGRLAYWLRIEDGTIAGRGEHAVTTVATVTSAMKTPGTRGLLIRIAFVPSNVLGMS